MITKYRLRGGPLRGELLTAEELLPTHGPDRLEERDELLRVMLGNKEIEKVFVEAPAAREDTR